VKVLVIGSGGREHAFVWKVSQSKEVTNILCVPGNAGMSELGVCVDINMNDFPGLVRLVKENNVDLTIVGPEAPLVSGIVDYFENEGLAIFGPNKKAAQLEGSKIFAKEFMSKYNIPTARFDVFDNPDAAKKCVEKVGVPLVVKADGLAGGKGAIICKTKSEAIAAIDMIMVEKKFGNAGNRILIEEMLIGEEASLMAFCDGETIVPMIASQDNKRVFDDDEGVNTGGMGAYAPTGVITEQIYEQTKKEVFDNFITGIKKEGIEYKGIVYAGIIITKKGPKALEFNVRFGDPETQVLLPLLKTDMVKVVSAVIDKKLDKLVIEWERKSCVCVVITSKGYPGNYEKEKEISGLEEIKKIKDVVVFHSGTAFNSEKKLQTAGGRVLGVTAVGNSLDKAIDLSYQTIEEIKFDGMHYRNDIGKKGIKKFVG
jgi:phosphoribosylamine--glycine ligase